MVANGNEGDHCGQKGCKWIVFSMVYVGQILRKAVVRTVGRDGLNGSACHVLDKSLLSCLHGRK
jgi:hypothetical protein